MLFSRTLLIAALAATSASAQTQSQIEKRYTRDYSGCMDASGGVTVEMMNCTAAEIDIPCPSFIGAMGDSMAMQAYYRHFIRRNPDLPDQRTGRPQMMIVQNGLALVDNRM